MNVRVPSRRVRPVETVLKALAYRRRLLLLAALADGRPRELRALAAQLGLPLKTVSRNLRVLERAGLVEGTVVRGRARYHLPHDAVGRDQAIASAVMEAVLGGRRASALPRHGWASSAGRGPTGGVGHLWSWMRGWLTRWMSSW